MAETLEQMIYQMIKDVEGYKGHIYYDDRNIPTFGAGVALIYYNKTTGTYQERQTVGNVTMKQFLTLITGSSTTAEIIKNLIANDLKYLQTKEGSLTGKDEYKKYISNYSENNFIENIWNGNVAIYDQYIDGVKNSLGNTLFNQLTDVQKTMMFSLNYASLLGKNLKTALSHYISSDAEESFIGKMSVWYEILYQSNNNVDVSDRPGQQNRRFMEANSFITGSLASKPTASTASSSFPVSNYNEAKLAIAFMNCKAEEMLAFYKSGSFGKYANRNYEIVRNHFSEAVATFLSNQNYTGSHNINTLFTEWNLYTDLKIDLNGNGRPEGTTSYGKITGSDKKDLIFITGDKAGTEVKAGAENDFVGGSSKKDVIYSGKGDDVIYSYGGNDEVNTTESTQKDINRVYLGAGSDIFEGGIGRDIVDGGTGKINYSYVCSNHEGKGSNQDTNNIRLGTGNDEYYGGIGIDKVRGGYGDDIIYGGDNADTLHGDGGNDTLDGGEGDNEIYGGTGNDTIKAAIKDSANDNERSIWKLSA